MLLSSWKFWALDMTNSVSSSSSKSSSSSGKYLNKVLQDGHADPSNLLNGHAIIKLFAGTYKFVVWACVIGIITSVFLYQRGQSKNSDRLRLGGSGAVWGWYVILLTIYFSISFYVSRGQLAPEGLLAVFIISVSEYIIFFFAPKQYVNAMHAYAIHEMSDRQDIKHTADKRASIATMSTAVTIVFILLALMLHSIF